MKTERELFQEKYLAKINTYAKFNQSKYTEEYEDCKEQACWEMWQASAQREGYKIVPVEPNKDLVNHGHQIFLGHFNEGGQTGGRSLYFAYKAMIGAAP